MSMKSPGLFFSRVTVAHALALLVSILTISNLCFVLTYRQADIDRVNALGLVLMQAKGPLSEAIHIMNRTIMRGQIDVELWDVMLRDLIEHWRFYPAISYLDQSHRSRWTLIQDGIDELIRVVTDVIQACNRRGIALLDLMGTQLTSICSVRDILMVIEMNTFPRSIVTGSDPKVTVSDDGIKRTVEAVSLLQVQLEELRKIVQV